MDHKNRRGKEIPAGQKQRRAFMGIIGMVLTIAALWDLRHRPDSQVKGKKLVWVLVSFVQPLGPAIYLLFGRKRVAAG